uniref:Envelope glycoprotein n=1 Tax=Strix occidentalis caurina TaxID=311401 RepID=A0A8D0F341_STROC
NLGIPNLSLKELDCIAITMQGDIVSHTLIYHTHYKCKGQIMGDCVYNQTKYKLCKDPSNNKIMCYDPEILPTLYWIELKTEGWIKKGKEKGKYDGWKTLAVSNQVYNLSSSVSVIFDVSSGVYGGHLSSPTCGLYDCTLVNLTIIDLGSWKRRKRIDFGIKIWASGYDPGAKVRIIYHEKVRQTMQHRFLFNSFYHEIETGVKYEIPTVAKNLFVKLAESIAKTLRVTNCYVCGGTNQGEHWPWEALESNITDYRIWKVNSQDRRQQWILQTNIVGRSCFQHLAKEGEPVGNLICEGGYIWNKTRKDWDKWGNTMEINSQVANWTNGNNIPNGWPALEGHYWICGKLAFATLPKNWVGSCIVSTIRPSFFLLPIGRGERLGVPVYTESDEFQRHKRDLQIGNWKDNEWPPERIIAYYDPATRAEDGSWGYRTPIYMLNRIIRLQAVVETVVNKTGDALSLIAKQNTKMRTAIYQNRLALDYLLAQEALDYLLAQEGGVCGKFNLTNCCIQIDDEGKAIDELVRDMKKVAHVPVQTWNGFNIENLGSWMSFFNGDWITKVCIVLLGIFGGLLLTPCIIPCFIQLIRSVVQSMQPEIKNNRAPLMVFETKPTPISTAV